MAIKLVASDLDGTLLGSDSRLTPRTTEALRAIDAAGIQVVAVTGRSHWSSVEILRPAGCFRWIICSNGATVYDFSAEAVVHDRPLDDYDVEHIVDRLRTTFPSVGFAWESPNGIFHSPQWVTNRSATDSRFVAKRSRQAKELSFDDGPILKLMIAHHELTTYEWLDAVVPHLPNGFSASTSGAAFVEVTRGDANKGAALEHLCVGLSIDREETIAFGDHSNDLPMLTWVGTGYAMANADPRVRQVADRTAPPNGEDGVAQILEGLL